MKKVVLMSVLICLLSFKYSYAQQLRLGFFVVPSASAVGSDPLTVSTGVFTFAGLATEKTYHNLVYAWGNNSIMIINGWKYTKSGNQDLYLVFSKNLSKNGGYLGIGWEYAMTNGSFTAFPFIELGTNWSEFKKPIYTIGIILPVSKTLWKKK